MSGAELFYVVGRSGSGKDTVLSAIRHIPGCTLAHRYITRPAMSGHENHIELSRSEFNVRKQLGAFLLTWEAHDLQYGIGIEVQQWLAAGLHVFVNGSRAYLPEAKRKLGNQIKTLLVDAKPETCAARLKHRGREAEENISKRVTRQVETDIEYDWIINNDGPIENTLYSITKKLQQYVLANESTV